MTFWSSEQCGVRECSSPDEGQLNTIKEGQL